MTQLKDLPVERMSRKAFESLPEYTISLPTGHTIGKVWKCDENYRSGGKRPFWKIGEYVTCSEPGMIGISWRRIEIIEPPPEPKHVEPVKKRRAGRR